MNETNQDLWNAMHEIRDRVTRIEERSIGRDEKIAAMASNVQDMHEFFLQSKGGFAAATAMTKFAYGFGGIIVALLVSNWQAFKRFIGLF